MPYTSSSYIPHVGDRVRVVGLHNDDNYSKKPDSVIGKEYEVLSQPRSFREGSWAFGATDEDVVFFAAIVEPVAQQEPAHA